MSVDFTDFFPSHQRRAIRQLMQGEEGDWFKAKVRELANIIESMPVTYDQDGLGDDAVAYLHYFSPAGDWYITERDVEDEQHQAFGYTDLGSPELGYISLVELCKSPHVELDLHFAPKTLGAIKVKHEPANG